MKVGFLGRTGRGNMADLDFHQLDLKARLGAFSELDSEVMMLEVAKLEPGDVYLEVGVDKGKSLSIARMVAKEGVEVCGVDLNSNPEVPGTTFFQGDSVEMANRLGNAIGKISVLFIDGDHTYAGCKRDIEAWYPHMKERGIMFFHDCDESSPGVVQAVFEFFNNLPKDGKAGIFLYKYNNKNTSICKIQL